VKRGAALALAVALTVALAVELAGCGGTSLSTSQLRARAARICGVAQLKADRIPTPTVPAQGASYLRLGIAVLAPEVKELRALPAPGDQAGAYRGALKAVAAEMRALRSSLKGLKDGNDPVVAIKTLQQQLRPLEARADEAWRSLAIPACSGA
jgi:hypothetical protein